MAIVNRITRLFTADVHAVLDRLEEPDALLRQAIREMDVALAGQSHTLKLLESDRERLRARIAEIQRGLNKVSEELDLSFSAKHEALIRTSLRRRLEGERLLKMLEQRLSVLDQKIAQLTPALEQQRERLESMRQKAAAFDVETANCHSGECSSWSAEDICISEADIDLALLREQQVRRSA
jgi:phage shock protein A